MMETFLTSSIFMWLRYMKIDDVLQPDLLLNRNTYTMNVSLYAT